MKIPIIDLVALTYHFAIKNLGSLVVIYLQALLAMVLGGLLLIFVIVVPPVLILKLSPLEVNWTVFGTYAMQISGAYAMSATAVLVHRSIVLRETLRPLAYARNILKVRTMKFFMAGLIFWAVLAPLLAPGPLFLWVKDVGIFSAAYISTIVLTFFLFRYIYVYPAIATDFYESLSACRNRIRGNAWRTFWAVFLVNLPFVVLGRFSSEAMTALDIVIELIAGLGSLTAVIALSYSYFLTGSAAVNTSSAHKN